MENMLISNKERAREVSRIILDDYRKGVGIFSKIDETPDEFLPSSIQRSGLEHALFLFYLNSLNYGTKTESLFLKGKRFYECTPEMFNPSNINSLDSYKIKKELVQNLQVRFPEQATKRWKINSRKLSEEYHSDPRNLFDEGLKKGVERLLDFYGYGPKISHLLTYFYIEQNIIRLQNRVGMEFPIDSHDINISLWTGIVQTKRDVKNKSSLALPIQRFYTEFCNEEGIDMAELDKALWIIGAYGGYPKRNPENDLNYLCLDAFFEDEKIVKEDKKYPII